MSDTPRTDAVCDAIAKGEVNDYSALRDLCQQLERSAIAMDATLNAVYTEALEVPFVQGDRIRKMIRDCGREVGREFPSERSAPE